MAALAATRAAGPGAEWLARAAASRHTQPYLAHSCREVIGRAARAHFRGHGPKGNSTPASARV